MKKCVKCNKVMTDDLELVKSKYYTYTPSKDVDFDKICDRCDARGRARACANTILGLMGTHKEVCRNGKINDEQAFLHSKLARLKEEWVENSMTFLSEKDRETYSNWVSIFKAEVDTSLENATDMEDKKKTNY